MTAIIAFFTTSAIGRTLAKIGALVLAVLTFGAWNRRHGAKAQKAKQDAADAKAEREAHERINRADTGAGLDDDQRIDRLREFAAKHGNRPPKGTGR